jgi:hypothetical protein
MYATLVFADISIVAVRCHSFCVVFDECELVDSRMDFGEVEV